MADSIKKLIKFLDTHPHDFAPSTLEFMSLDLEKVRCDMDLADRGQRRGAANLPPAESSAFDEVEMEVIYRITTHLKADRQTFDSAMSVYGQRLHGMGLQEFVSQIKTYALGAQSEFKLEVSQGRDDIYNVRRDVVEFEDAFEAFKRAHRLNRPASYPENHWYHYGAIAVLFLIETLINAGMFSIGHLGGILGGVVEAILVSIINVLFLGLLIAPTMWRLAHHRGFLRRVTGVLGVALFFCAALGFNLFVAHYREAFEGVAPQEARLTALVTFTQSPLHLKQAPSWMLWALGVFFALLAAVDGVMLNDVYPGYGRRDRDRRERNERFGRTKSDLLKFLRNVRDNAVSAMREAMGELEKRRDEMVQAAEGQSRFVGRFRGQVKSLEDAANQLLMTYRDANQAAREKPAPRHFGERWSLLDPGYAVVADPPPTDDSEIKGLIAQTTQALDEAIAHVHRAYDEAIAQYERIEQMTAREFRDGAPVNTAP
ncbi:MAG: hypothetical protein FJY54_18250 [Betaproteobacteria bacterium]|nr:hypothetical protein [Betaproteobacteria bacterium]